MNTKFKKHKISQEFFLLEVKESQAVRTADSQSDREFCDSNMITAQIGLHSILAITKNALTEAFSLACLEIRSRNEEAINSTWNRI